MLMGLKVKRGKPSPILGSAGAAGRCSNPKEILPQRRRRKETATRDQTNKLKPAS